MLGLPASIQTNERQPIPADQPSKPKESIQNSPASSVGEFRADQETAL
jgi:hypothetical protein